ncbi:MAG TPA: nucleotidyltransferase [Opitutus sp.]|nr:nucleotidyltransferase [Opitutus sp.]
MQPPTLLVLAAGMGSRYGGLKQIDPVGPAGETVLDYAVFDALRAGFGRVVFVIRREFEALFRERVGAKYAGRTRVDYVFQSLDSLPSGFAAPTGREKPWGTGHAVWCAREAVRENFAVINADDFYGRDSFVQLAAFLQQPSAAGAAGSTEFAMVGFRLANTLSEHGAVSRGICASGAGHRLRSIVERTGIHASEVGRGRELSGDEIVSMNCWGFRPALFPALDRQFGEFLQRAPDAKAEFYLPAAVSTMIARGEAAVRVLPTASARFGVTYREDNPRVVSAIEDLVRGGAYPAKLF